MNAINVFNHLGEEVNMFAYGLSGLKIVIPSPSYRVNTEQIDGQAGELIVEKVLDSRLLDAEFSVKASDYVSSLDLRDQLYEVFGNGHHLFIVDTNQPYKRWKVHANDWTPDRINRTASKIKISLLAESGTAETINVLEKTFITSTFRFENEGNVLIDPRSHFETEIMFKGASSNLRIRNLTTGDEWSWNGSTLANDVILLKGVRSLKNSVSVFKHTNKKLITLAPGWNDFEIIGATGGFELNIRSRFYFL
jgi:hypothetical protein